MPQKQTYCDPAREEKINGEIVPVFPRPGCNHNRVASNILYAFGTRLEDNDCIVIPFNTDLYLTDGDWFIPDGMIVCDRNKIQWDGVHGAPDLVVEVLSPRSLKNDRGYKKDAYAKHGVGEYWIVNPDSKSVEVYRLENGSYVLHEAYSIYPDWMLKDMEEKDAAKIATKFKCSLSDDFEISLEDIFSGLLP